jgi:hypothetical protein
VEEEYEHADHGPEILQAFLRFFQNCDPVMSASISFQNVKGDGLWINFFSD